MSFELVANTDMSNNSVFRVAHEINQMAISTLTPMEIDFFFAFISDIKKDDKNFKKYTITKDILSEKLKRRLDKYRAKNLLKRMLGKQIWLETDKKLEGWNIFSKLSYDKEKEIFEVLFNPELLPFLIRLKIFTLGDTKYLFALESKYQKQMYLLISQWKKKGTFTIQVDALMKSFNLTDSMRVWGQFKRIVLDASVRAFFNKSDVIFEWEVTKKKGRRIDQITFTIQDNPHFKKSKASSLFTDDDLSSEFDIFYGKEIKTKQGIFKIVRIASISDELHIYFDGQDGFLALPDIATLEKVIKV